ncbi:MAG TPA: hypothetical protein VN894_10750 [Polyangiaceae bacterium]|nr:hypothetical protein [Polyangiaceae bacterium]
MTQRLRGCCCVCGASDTRTLVDIDLAGGARATLCGSHAIMHSRAATRARSESELRELLRDRRGRRDRRELGDELGAALTDAFNDERRAGDRRQA